MSDVSAILLAAGESRRMGRGNKLTLEVGGRPLLRRSAEVLLDSHITEVVVVLGHQAQAAVDMLKDLPVRTVFNPRHQDGQMTSVHCGMAEIAGPCDGIMVCLADQPLLEPTDIDHLIAAFADRSHGSVLVPTHEGRRGNPIILDYAHRANILAGGRNLGCRRFIDDNPHLVCTVEMPDNHVIVDIDTPGDYASLA